MILEWRHFEYKARFEKRALIFRPEIGFLKNFSKDYTKEVLKIYKSIVIKNNFKPVTLCPIK